jgi:hypothetical protein
MAVCKASRTQGGTASERNDAAKPTEPVYRHLFGGGLAASAEVIAAPSAPSAFSTSRSPIAVNLAGTRGAIAQFPVRGRAHRPLIAARHDHLER